MNALIPAGPNGPTRRERLWEHCRNSLGTARLLTQERRPEALVATACHLAAESALRAALDAAGEAWSGEVDADLARLALPAEVWPDLAGPAQEQVRRTERAVATIAACLRERAPERRWGV